MDFGKDNDPQIPYNGHMDSSPAPTVNAPCDDEGNGYRQKRDKQCPGKMDTHKTVSHIAPCTVHLLHAFGYFRKISLGGPEKKADIRQRPRVDRRCYSNKGPYRSYNRNNAQYPPYFYCLDRLNNKILDSFTDKHEAAGLSDKSPYQQSIIDRFAPV